ncbi:MULTISPECIES: HD-GYP domain-containing protein [unclassified Cobetia]|uniref:HD-GYP domain-containing protein n=1 Tax=unclassified Cobetia TaxID=2609414 RepID=UPI002097894C|nr:MULTISPECIES: HD domain-containing phosphohydrolase [unclassified Cobetia]MCO7231468.1 HD domain-containing protein [Cobetia sp. Dlab-2-AX]MCO7235217.1 HD domain-containing protein [Cobetia sp. Dlab-2-U]
MEDILFATRVVLDGDDPLPGYLALPPPGEKPLEPAVICLLRVLYQHDSDTLAHSWRVAGLAVFLYSKLLPAAKRNVPLSDLHSAALLHDIGKIDISNELLTAPRALSQEERITMRGHASHGGRLLLSLRGPLRALACQVAITHHEAWNGTGYPTGTGGKSLPLYCQVVAMMDVFDALASPRAYKPGWSLVRLVRLFREESGKQFDPRLVARMAPLWRPLHAEHRRLFALTSQG